jgi:signal peptide peptidase SppA
MLFGIGTTYSTILRAVLEAVADRDVTAILLRVHSPGGDCQGLEETADALHRAGATKPIIAHGDAMVASAAYWLAAQAHQIILTPSGEAGSLGVLATHDNLAGAAEKAGMKREFITSAPFKAEGHPFGPLSPEARAHLQRRVDERGRAFVEAVARGRGVSTATVAERFGQGRMLDARSALAAGMVDAVAPFAETLARVAAHAGSTALAARHPAALRSRSLALAAAGAAGALPPARPDRAEAERLRARLRLAEAAG